MSTWGQGDETVATAEQLRQPAAKWGHDDEIVIPAGESQGLIQQAQAAPPLPPGQANAIRGAIAQANVPQTPEWWAQRREDSAKASASGTPAIIREPAYALAGLGGSLAGTLSRPFSKDVADYHTKNSLDISEEADIARQKDWSPWLSSMYGGVVQSAAQAAGTAPLGQGGMIGGFALTEGNKALYEAEQAGLKGADRIKYAVLQGGIEGSIAGALSLAGLGGTEKFVSDMAKGVMKTSWKQAGKLIGPELFEELLTELHHAGVEAAYGVSPEAMKPENFWPRMRDTVVQTIGQFGLAQGVAKVAQLRQKANDLDVMTGKGFVSQQEAENRGYPPGSRKDRMKSAKEEQRQLEKQAAELEKQTAELEKQVQANPPPVSQGDSNEVQQDVQTGNEGQGNEVQPGSEAQPANPEVQPPVAEAVPEAPVSGFTTSKGSTYTVSGQSTTRTKSPHDFHETTDVGVKDPSEVTYYVTPEQAREIGMHGQLEGKWAAIVRDGTLHLVAWNEKEGRWGKSSGMKTIPLSDTPSVGKAPIELWKGKDSAYGREYSSLHAGNEITQVTNAPASVPQVPIQPQTASESEVTPEVVPPPEATQTAKQSVLKPQPEVISTKSDGLKPASSEQPEEVSAKEPWQMTRKEFISIPLGMKLNTESEAFQKLGKKRQAEMLSKEAAKDAKNRAIGEWTDEDLSRSPRDDAAAHRNAVEKALAEGKPVPQEVLADYPELASSEQPPAEHLPKVPLVRKDLRQEFPIHIGNSAVSEASRTTGKHGLKAQPLADMLEPSGVAEAAAKDATKRGEVFVTPFSNQSKREATNKALHESGLEPVPDKLNYWRMASPAAEPVQEAAPVPVEEAKPKPLRKPPSEPQTKKRSAKKPKAEKPPQAEPTDTGEFGRDVSNTLGIANGVPLADGKIGKSVRHFFQRFFATRGELPEDAYDANVRKEGRVAKEMARLQFAGTDFRRGIKKALGGKELTQADAEKMNSVLRGEADESTVPEAVREPLRAMRDHIDSLSRALISEGVAQGDLVGTITEHMGVYATRSYRVFDDPKWRENVPEGVRNRAVQAIRQMAPNKSDAEVQGLVESLLFRGAAETPVSLLKGSKLGAKDLSTFMARKDVPEWLRDLWGEYKDAGVNYARSVFKMSHLLANQQFLNSVKESGSGKWLRTAEDGPIVNEYGDVITQIAAEGSSVMEPLNGMYTTPEIKAAFERLTSPGALPNWLRAFMTVNYAVKYGKTVGSAITHERNLISNTGFAVANGHWRLDKAGKAVWGTTTGLFKLPDAEFRAFYERAAELGLVGEDVRAGELKAALRDASKADMDEFLYNAPARQASKIVKAGRAGFKFINTLYQAEDGVWKLYAWENEKARYAKAHPEWSQDQVEKHAAEIVRNTYPTYSKIPEAVRFLRAFPLIGPFVSFPSEVVRTTFHTIKLGLEEMQAPETRAFGAQRLAGTAVAIGGLTVLSKGIMAMFGIGDDEDDDLRWFVPPWQENSRFVYLAKPIAGVYRFLDLGYSDPHAYLTDAAIAFSRGEDWKDRLSKSATELLRPFFSEDILAKTLMDVRGNDEQKIYNPNDEAGEQAKDIIAYIWNKALEPGTISSLRRINTAREGTDPNLEVKTEVLTMTTGQRLQKVDVEHSLGFRVREFAKALTQIQDIARETATSRGTATGEMVATDVARMEKLRLAEFSQMQRIVGAARRLGVPEENIKSMLNDALSDEVAKQVLTGDYAPYEMTPQTVQQMLKANPKEFQERFSGWHGEKLPEAISMFATPRLVSLPTERPEYAAKAEQYDRTIQETKETLDALGVTVEQADALLMESVQKGEITAKTYYAKSAKLQELYGK